jgi:hypothetical protein
MILPRLKTIKLRLSTAISLKERLFTLAAFILPGYVKPGVRFTAAASWHFADRTCLVYSGYIGFSLSYQILSKD